MLKRLNLKQRIIGLIVIGFWATATMMALHSEDVIEEVILAQVEKQAEVFLFGLADEIRRLTPSLDADKAQLVLDEVIKNRREQYGFSIDRLYIYNGDGRIIADSRRKFSERKDMTGFHGEVIRSGKSFIGRDIEHYTDATGRLVPHADIIIPLALKDGIVNAIEVEINLEKTMEHIRMIDDSYENDIIFMLAISVFLMFLMVWAIIKRGLINPIHDLSTATRKIADGDLSWRVTAETKSEMDDLGRSINQMADSIEELFDEQERAYMQTLKSLSKALEAKDAYTAGHSERVSDLSVKLGKALNLPDDQLELLRQGAFMHDLGKIGISDVILNKEGILERGEQNIMDSHPVKTAEILEPLKRFKVFAEIAAWHHERWDGKGHPDGLKGEDVPLLARIVAIADSWDAMTTDRRYRKGLPAEKALAIMEEEKDSGQWDPELIEVFIQMMKEEKGK